MGSSAILPTPGQPSEGADPNFTTGAVPNIVTFSFDKIGPPSAVYIQRDDILQCKFQNSVAGMGFIVSARLLMPIGPLPGQPDQKAADPNITAQQSRGWVNTIRQEFFPPSDRSPQTFSLPLAEGYLLSVSVAYDFTLGSVNRGQAFVAIGLARFTSGAGRFMQLISDDIGLEMDLAWPGGSIRAPTEGPGFIHSIQQANPAAGADFTFTAATRQRLRIASFQAQFAASATVATRNVSVIVDDGVNAVWTADVAAGITASTTDQIVGTGTNSPTGVIATVQSVVLPPGLILAPGWRIRSTTAGIQVGDQWSAIWFNVEEWINS